jgi:hypothetical protein
VVSTAFAEPARTVRGADRLGFRFEAKAHDAAVAADSGSNSLAAEPPPAGVVRLPRHVVLGERVPFEGDDLLTPEGRIQVAKKRHLSPLYQMTFGPVAAVLSFLNDPLAGWHPNTPEAMALYQQAEQRRRSLREADLADLAALAEQAKKLEAAGRVPPAKTRQRQP